MSPHISAGPAGVPGGTGACVLEPLTALSTEELTRHLWGRCSAEPSALGGKHTEEGEREPPRWPFLPA